MEKQKNKINWSGIILIVEYAVILGFLALGLPQKICKLNGLTINCGYGRFAAYVCIVLLFWMITRDIKVQYSQSHGKVKA